MGNSTPAAQAQHIFETHHAAVRDYCRRRLQHDGVADAVADVFLVAVRRIDEIPAGAERPWLFGIARNVVRNHQRRERRWSRLGAKLTGLARLDGDVETVIVRRLEEQMVLDALATLRPSDQEILRLRAWEELSSADIGIALGISSEAVDMRLTRAKRRLARSLSASGYAKPSVPMPRTTRNGEEE
jgi:RNA polymerase sigma factor (sigma-70 family)